MAPGGLGVKLDWKNKSLGIVVNEILGRTAPPCCGEDSCRYREKNIERGSHWKRREDL